MNALQAMVKLDKLKDEIMALETAINTMEMKDADSYLIRIIKDMRADKFKQQKELEEDMRNVKLSKQY